MKRTKIRALLGVTLLCTLLVGCGESGTYYGIGPYTFTEEGIEYDKDWDEYLHDSDDSIFAFNEENEEDEEVRNESTQDSDDRVPKPSEDPARDPATIQIPILLSASGTTWIDQCGNVVDNSKVEEFCQENLDLFADILRLNKNPYYATKLISSERGHSLEYWWDFKPAHTASYSGDDISSEELYAVYKLALEANPPDEKYIDMFYDKVDYNGACYDLDDIKTDLASGASDSYNVIDKLFFSCLTRFAESGTYEDLMDVEPFSMPVILTQEGNWLDQNLKVLPQSTVNSYFANHPAIARDVYHNNTTANPFLDASLLDEELSAKLGYGDNIYFYEENEIGELDYVAALTYTEPIEGDGIQSAIHELERIGTLTCEDIVDNYNEALPYQQSYEITACFGDNLVAEDLSMCVHLNTLAKMFEKGGFVVVDPEVRRENREQLKRAEEEIPKSAPEAPKASN